MARVDAQRAFRTVEEAMDKLFTVLNGHVIASDRRVVLVAPDGSQSPMTAIEAARRQRAWKGPGYGPVALLAGVSADRSPAVSLRRGR